ncbi:MAG: VanW family protein [Clostridiales Family XIII bacterium]|nr:VanW family protein [Clostridiales Family XIII bacterium]
MDYRFRNNTEATFQILARVDGEYLCGELRADRPPGARVHIREEEAYFYEEGGAVFRHNKIYRKVVDKRTGDIVADEPLLENRARVLYDRGAIAGEILAGDPACASL